MLPARQVHCMHAHNERATQGYQCPKHAYGAFDTTHAFGRNALHSNGCRFYGLQGVEEGPARDLGERCKRLELEMQGASEEVAMGLS